MREKNALSIASPLEVATLAGFLVLNVFHVEHHKYFTCVTA